MLDILYPPRCPVCDSVMESGQKVCVSCKDVMVRIREPRCMHCGKPLNEDTMEYCHDCANRGSSNYVQGLALWLYDKQAGQSLARFKYMGRREYAAYYAQEMAEGLGEMVCRWNADVLIPVPIHKKRLRKRGYNQAQLLAEEFGKRVGIPVIPDYIVRTKDTRAQKDLDNRDRRNNLKKAFCLKEIHKELYNPPHCAIIMDDIYTTGSTVEACAGVLLQAGIEKVYYISLCIGRGI